MNKEHFIENYSRWSSIALICIVILASGVGIADIAFEFKNDKNVASKLKALELLSKNLALQTVKNENKDVIEVKLVEDEPNV